MRGCRNEAVDWAEGRGWKAGRHNGGHVKLTHPDVPGVSVTTSSTPSDHRAAKQAKAKIKAVEAAHNIDPPPRKLRRTGSFRMGRTPDKRVRYEVECRDCNKTEEWLSRPGSKPSQSSLVRERFEKMGWKIGETRSRDQCPVCFELKERKAEPAPEATPPVKPAQPETSFEMIVSIPRAGLSHLDAAVSTGLYGTDREDTARSLLLRAMEKFTRKVRGSHGSKT